MYLAAGEVPNQPSVHGAEEQIALFGLRPRAGNVVQNPLDFGAGEVGINEQTGFIPDISGHAVCGQLITNGCGAAALPDNGVVNGLSGVLIPNNGGFPLVGDADAGNVCGRQTAFFVGLLQCVKLGVQNHHGVMLHPTGFRVNLGEGVLRQSDDIAVSVKNNGAGTGGSLVQCNQISVHIGSSVVDEIVKNG